MLASLSEYPHTYVRPTEKTIIKMLNGNTDKIPNAIIGQVRYIETGTITTTTDKINMYLNICIINQKNKLKIFN